MKEEYQERPMSSGPESLQAQAQSMRQRARTPQPSSESGAAGGLRDAVHTRRRGAMLPRLMGRKNGSESGDERDETSSEFSAGWMQSPGFFNLGVGTSSQGSVPGTSSQSGSERYSGSEMTDSDDGERYPTVMGAMAQMINGALPTPSRNGVGKFGIKGLLQDNVLMGSRSLSPSPPPPPASQQHFAYEAYTPPGIMSPPPDYPMALSQGTNASATKTSRPARANSLLMKESESGLPLPVARRRGRGGRRLSLKQLLHFARTSPGVFLLGLVTLASFIASTIITLKHVLSHDREPVPWRFNCAVQAPFPHALADRVAPVTVFVGVFSVDSASSRRDLIRQTYMRAGGLDGNGNAQSNIQVKFILGRPRAKYLERIALEMEMYNDIVVLDVYENMNFGKTFKFFQWAAENATIPVAYEMQDSDIATSFTTPADTPRYLALQRPQYIVKADDDAFIVLSELERNLRLAPRHLAYWGYLVRGMFMAGETYGLSMDLVDYIATAPQVQRIGIIGKEDQKLSKWIRAHPQASDIAWISERCWIYDQPKAPTIYAHGYLFPDYVEQIKYEYKFGLTPAERLRRGDEFYASYSTTRNPHPPYMEYVPPREGMTMHERVEALIEGGGRYAPISLVGGSNRFKYELAQSSDPTTSSSHGNKERILTPPDAWLAPPPVGVSKARLIMQPNDPRLYNPSVAGLAVQANVSVVQGSPERDEPPAMRKLRFGKQLYAQPGPALATNLDSLDDSRAKVDKVTDFAAPDASDGKPYYNANGHERRAAAEEDPDLMDTGAPATDAGDVVEPDSETGEAEASDGAEASEAAATSDGATASDGAATSDEPAAAAGITPTDAVDTDADTHTGAQISHAFPERWTVPPTGDKLMRSPGLRYDPDAARVRSERMRGLPHGGTVVVHYLKSDEHFLEAALALLPQGVLWDQGHPAQPVSYMTPWRGDTQVRAVPHAPGVAPYGSPMIHGGRVVHRPSHTLLYPNM